MSIEYKHYICLLSGYNVNTLVPVHGIKKVLLKKERRPRRVFNMKVYFQQIWSNLQKASTTIVTLKLLYFFVYKITLRRRGIYNVTNVTKEHK